MVLRRRILFNNCKRTGIMIYVIFPNKYVDFSEELPSDSYKVGSTYEEYQRGDTWILLSDEQVSFHEVHPSASTQEVINMQLNEVITPPTAEVDELAEAKRVKMAEIQSQDDFSNKFFVSVVKYKRNETGEIQTSATEVDENGVPIKLTEELANYELWIDRSMRDSLLTCTFPSLLYKGKKVKRFNSLTLPKVSFYAPIEWAKLKIMELEVYATETYDLKDENEILVDKATSVEEINAIDVKANYPLFLTFQLNIELWADVLKLTE